MLRVRHRVPSIFNLSMVDVLCCALGCVILLWLVNLRSAKQHTDDAEAQAVRASQLLADASLERDDALLMLEELQALVERLEGEKKTSRDRVLVQEKQLEDLEARARELLTRLAALQSQLKTSEEELASTTRTNTTLNTDLLAALSRIKDLQGVASLVPGMQADLKSTQTEMTTLSARLKEKETELARRQAELDETLKNLELALATRKKLEGALTTTSTQLSQRTEELSEARTFRTKWLAAERSLLELQEKLTDREKRLASAINALGSSQEATRSLQTEISKLRTAEVNRFAGITLTGRRVVFLVDRSGSMLESAEKVPAPTKWGEVRNTVSRLMRSLPNLEKYQVVLFSKDAEFPMGVPGQWLSYDPETSPEQMIKALADPRLTPEGGTNMYAGLEAAFSLRSQGLDTIYLLSDGLPSLGPGVDPSLAASLGEVRLGQQLGSFVRAKLRAEWNRRAADQARVRINSIGFFYESPDVGAFLWALSRENDGSFVGMSYP